MASITPIARTGGRFASFAPYVASINDHGVVAFQAGLAEGGTGVFVGSGDEVTRCGGDVAVFSHPAIDVDGAVSFYGRQQRGPDEVLLFDGALRSVAEASGGMRAIGPLGPTMSRHGGYVGFRAELRDGAAGLFWSGVDTIKHLVAATGDGFASFEGLPVVIEGDRVVFRATTVDGIDEIQVWDGSLSLIADTRGRFASLGRFPGAADGGTVVFAAVCRDGSAGIFEARDGRIETVVDSSAGFESFRGALVTPGGELVFYATPPGAELGIYRRDGGSVLAIGDELLGSHVLAFVLNPVSIAAHGRLAVRVELADGSEAIVRVEPDDD
jgi:hypothetical protein